MGESLIETIGTRHVIFFGGKGGVGKTTTAAAYALLAADGGLRTLLVSTDPAHSTSDVLQQTLSSDPTQVAPNLYALEIDPETEVESYIAEVKHRIADSTPPRLHAEVQRQIDIARISPGAEESALFDRFARILQTDGASYDRIVFDTAPTGHTLRLLSLPETMTAWVTGLIAQRQKVNILGRMWRNVAGAVAGSPDDHEDPVLAALEERRRRFVAAREIVTDGVRTAFVFVVIPERLPIIETDKAVRALDKYGIPVGGVVVNRVLPADVDGAFLVKRREREATYLRDIETRFDTHPVHHVQLLDTDVVGLDALRRIGALLAADGGSA